MTLSILSMKEFTVRGRRGGAACKVFALMPVLNGVIETVVVVRAYASYPRGDFAYERGGDACRKF